MGKNSLSLWLSWRGLAVTRGLGLTLMTWISIGGVALGVSTLIVVLSVMGGFEKNLVDKMLNAEPHGEMYFDSLATGFSLKEWPLSKLESAFPEIKKAAPFVKTEAVMRFGKSLQSVSLLGLGSEYDNSAWVSATKLIEGEIEDLEKELSPMIIGGGSSDRKFQSRKNPTVILGVGLAESLSVDVGDEVSLINPQTVGSSTGALESGTLIQSYTVVGLFFSGHSEQDSKYALVSMKNARSFMVDFDPAMDNLEYVSGIGFQIDNPLTIDNYKEKIKKLDPEMNLSTWRDNNSALLFALKLEKYAMGSVLMLTVLVAAFSISGTIMMTVHHRRNHICLLKALGMTKLDILKTYISSGCLIGFIGVAFGLVFGLIVCWIVWKYPIPLPSAVYVQTALPVRFLPEIYGVVALFSILLSTLSALYPSILASRISPSQGLRYE